LWVGRSREATSALFVSWVETQNIAFSSAAHTEFAPVLLRERVRQRLLRSHTFFGGCGGASFSLRFTHHFFSVRLLHHYVAIISSYHHQFSDLFRFFPYSWSLDIGLLLTAIVLCTIELFFPFGYFVEHLVHKKSNDATRSSLIM